MRVVILSVENAAQTRPALFPNSTSLKQGFRSFDGGSLTDLMVPGTGIAPSDACQFAVEFKDVGQGIAIGLAASLIYDGLKHLVSRMRVGAQQDVPLTPEQLGEALRRELGLPPSV